MSALLSIVGADGTPMRDSCGIRPAIVMWGEQTLRVLRTPQCDITREKFESHVKDGRLWSLEEHGLKTLEKAPVIAFLTDFSKILTSIRRLILTFGMSSCIKLSNLHSLGFMGYLTQFLPYIGDAFRSKDDDVVGWVTNPSQAQLTFRMMCDGLLLAWGSSSRIKTYLNLTLLDQSSY
jgi:hypothetical protein